MRSVRRLGFDWEGLFLAWGMGAAAVSLGALFCWVVLSGMPPGRTGSASHSLTQAAVRLLPQSVQQKIVLFLGAGFVLFGLFCVALGFYSILRHLLFRQRA